MPKLTEDELAAAIEAGEVKALTLDTSIFNQYGLDLRHPILESLSQFEGTDIKVLFSDIVEREVQTHIAADAKATKDALKSALAKFGKTWKLSDAAPAPSVAGMLDDDPVEFARSQWKAFIETIGASVLLAVDHLPVRSLVESYFDASPPFEASGKKKAEFPDAIALLSLEAWGRANGTKVLALSKDSGWHAFAEKSDHIIAMADPAVAFGLFNQADSVLAQRIGALVATGQLPQLNDEIKRAIEEAFDDSSIDVVADSSYQFEAEFAGAEVLRLTMVSGPSVLAADDETIELVFEFECEANYSAYFSWSTWDSIDKEDIPLGSDTCVARGEDYAEIIITFSRNFERVPDVLKIEISRPPDVPEFGEVGPDFGEE